MKKLAPGLLASFVFACIGTSVLAWGTDGFEAFTSESARRLAITREARPVPDVTLQDQDGERFQLSELHGKLLAVEFIYTTCPTLCNALGISFQRILDSLPENLAGKEIVLLSVSFNPEIDNPERLADYAKRYHAHAASWRVVRVEDRRELEALLRTFGVVVIPDKFGGYEHNAAIHIVDRNSRLVGIEDHDRVPEFAEKLRAWL